MATLKEEIDMLKQVLVIVGIVVVVLFVVNALF